MSRYSQSKSLADEETPVAIQDLDLPNDPKIGAEYWVDIFQSLVIWTGNSWQRLYTPPVTAQPGQVLYTTSSSSFIWSVPAGITSCSIVCVGQGGTGVYITVNGTPERGIWGGGGGALSYINNVSVSAGEEILIDFPERNTGYTGQNVTASRSSRVSRSDNTVICFAEAGGGATEGRSSEGIGDQTFSGGTPTRFDRSSSQVTTTRRWFAAGGGSGSFGSPAGRGFSGTSSASPDAGGGGTGLQGTTLPSSGQSFGAGKHGGDDSNFTSAAKYGGGGGVLEQYYGSGLPQIFYGSSGTGAVRIIYGDDRSFPDDAEDV